MRLTIFLALALVVPPLAYAAPATSLAVCVNPATGSVTARTKCKAGEVALNAKALASTLAVKGAEGPQGPAGPQGSLGPQGQVGPKGDSGILNVKSCYTRKDELQLSSGGRVGTGAICLDVKADFMLSDSFETQGGSPDVLVVGRTLEMEKDDTVPTGIYYDLLTFGTEQYQGRAVIVCCKR